MRTGEGDGFASVNSITDGGSPNNNRQQLMKIYCYAFIYFCITFEIHLNFTCCTNSFNQCNTEMSKHALVFGGTRGIGLAVARKFLSVGFSVTVCSRSKENLDSSLSLLQSNESSIEQQQKLRGMVCDVGSEDQVEKVFKTIREKAETVDVLVNSAGLNIDNLLVRTNSSDINAQVNTNLIGIINTCKNAVRLMVRQSSGSIINIGNAFELKVKCSYKVICRKYCWVSW